MKQGSRPCYSCVSPTAQESIGTVHERCRSVFQYKKGFFAILIYIGWR